MGKHEAPPFNMVVERGRLVPATEFDAERLDTWRNGSKVFVTFVRHGSRVMERKWWAVLNRAVKECKTPWNSSQEASEAIKLALGIVNLSKTVGGAWLQYPKSLTELTDPELDQAVIQMIDVILHVTGVDPQEWRKQIADIGKDEPSEAAPHSATGEGSGEASPPSPAATQSASAAAEAGGPEVAADQSTAPASERTMVNPRQMNTEGLKAEMVRKLLQLAGDQALTVQERLENLDGMKPLWTEHLTGFPLVVTQAFQTAAKIIKGELKADAGKKFMEGLL